MIKLLHIITTLYTGGAEMMLFKLLSRMDRAMFKNEVISLTDIGNLGEKIQALGIPVRALGMKLGVPNPLALLRLARWLRQKPPQVIQTWMYHADLIGGLANKLAHVTPLAWNIRHSNLDPQYNKGTTLLTAKACGRLSRWLPDRIVCGSEAARQNHLKLGYAAEKMIVIYNGFELDDFEPNPTARLSVRQEFGLTESTVLVGMVGRFHPQKDHHNFVQAAARLHALFPDVHFLLCGKNVTWDNHELAEWIKEAGISSHCHLLGRRDDMPRLTAALDIATSSSYGEGFSNVLGEAMACAVPCVVTDAGDSAAIVADTGKVVPVKNPPSLFEAWRELIEIGPEGRTHLGLAARQRVEKNFSLPNIVKQYERFYQELATCAA